MVTQEQAALVKPGMSREQVRDVLGSPLLTDVFHADRWDYVFTIRRQGAEPQRRSVVVLFEGDTLERIEAPDLPSEREFVASISRTAAAASRAGAGADRRAAQGAAACRRRPSRAGARARRRAPVRAYPPLEPQ